MVVLKVLFWGIILPFGTILALMWVWDWWTSRFLFKRLKASLDHLEKEAKIVQDMVQAEVVKKVLLGKKCRACGEVKDVEDVKDVPTAEGLSAPLCPKCRDLVGLPEDDKEQKKEVQ